MQTYPNAPSAGALPPSFLLRGIANPIWLVLSIILVLPSCNLIGLAASVGLAKLHFGCLPEGTFIDTASGPILVENLKAGDEIIGFHGKPVRVLQIHQYSEQPEVSRYLTVHFANGASVCTSPKHRIGGTSASQLRHGDSCGGTTVTHIEVRTGVSRSFDLLTSDPGYRISGIPVNSMILEMLNHHARSSQSQRPPPQSVKSRI